MLLGCVYIPPENTKYTSNESFTEIETEMLSLSNKYDCYTSLIGDMNAKTKLLEDVTVPDDSLFEILDEFDNQSLIPYMYEYQNLILKGLSLIAKSDDLSPPNNYGYILIDLSKRNNLYIGNSRLPRNDFMKGKKNL